ncbi:LOW QUALITY PROTEIN: copper-resistance protein, CopA family, partial [Acinetobacter lwoffii SH145]
KTPQQNWSGQFQPNKKVRLRFINASAMSFFDVRIPQLKMTVVSADGQAVQPVAVDEFRIGTAETYDVIVEPTAAHYQIEAESIDRSGFAIGSLHQATDSSKTAAPVQLPTPRPRALLTMEDMGHGEQHDMSHDAHSNQTTQSKAGTPKHDEHAQHTMHASHSAISETHQSQQPVEGWANMSTPAGHKALQYQDLKALTPQPDTRAAERELVIRLGGTMERYIWTMNGKKFSDAEPLQVKYGERIRLKFINDSMMAHPMHLHGMFMQLENGQSAANMPNKHTVIVPPGKTVTTLLTADELGEWAIHCHLLYHMSAGMMNKLIVAHVNDDQASHPSSQKMPSKPAAAEGASHAHH